MSWAKEVDGKNHRKVCVQCGEPFFCTGIALAGGICPSARRMYGCFCPPCFILYLEKFDSGVMKTCFKILEKSKDWASLRLFCHLEGVKE